MYINLDRITFECRTDLVCNTTQSTQGLGNQDQEVQITDKTGAVNCAEFVRDRYMFKDVGYGLSKHTKAMP